MKSAEEIMEILDAFDLTGSLRPPRSWRGVLITPSGRHVAGAGRGRGR